MRTSSVSTRKSKATVVAQTEVSKVTSSSMSLNRADIRQWLKNTAIFAAPVVLIYLLSVQSNLQDGASSGDFIPNAVTVGAMCLYVVNTLIDLVRKFATQNTYTTSSVAVEVNKES